MKDVFEGVEAEDDEDFELEKMAAVIKSQGGTIIGDNDNTVLQDNGEENMSDESSENEDDEKENSNKSANTGKAKKSKGQMNNTANTEDLINEWDVNDATVAAGMFIQFFKS